MNYVFACSWYLVKEYSKRDKNNNSQPYIIYFDHPWWNNYWHFMLEALPLIFIISNSYGKLEKNLSQGK